MVSAPACDAEGTLLPQRCGTAGCHAGASAIAGLDLASAGIAARTASKPASGGGILLVPKDPDASVLFRKLTKPAYGSTMPPGATLSTEDLACVRSWIEGVTP